MDTVTHVLTGVVVSQATFRGTVGRGATLLALAAAVTPDLDGLAQWFNPDPWVGMMTHRGPTHALLLGPVFAAGWAGLFWLVRRKQFRAMFLLAWLVLVSHVVLDLVTSYGTQLLWPITHRRFALDWLPIIDIFFTPILLLTAVGGWLAGWVGAWRVSAGPPKLAPAASVEGRGRRTVARLGLVLAGCYLGFGAWVDYRTVRLAEQAVPADHGPAVQVRSGPLIGTVFGRRLVVRTPEGFYVARHNALWPADRLRWAWAPADGGRFVERADGLEHIRTFRWFSMGLARPVVEHAADDRGHPLVRVTYHDMRYGYPADSTRSIFWTYVILDGQDEQVLHGPEISRWSGRRNPPGGPAAFFDPPGNHLNLGGGRWSRLKAMWHEAWRE